MDGLREYWLYELNKGNGVYQGCTGPGAEGIVRRVVESLELEPHLGNPPGEPFRVFCFEGLPHDQPTPLEMFQADHAAVQAAGFHDTGELLSAYNTLVRKHDWIADRLQQAEALLEELRDSISHGVSRARIDAFLGKE